MTWWKVNDMHNTGPMWVSRKGREPSGGNIDGRKCLGEARVDHGSCNSGHSHGSLSDGGGRPPKAPLSIVFA